MPSPKYIFTPLFSTIRQGANGSGNTDYSLTLTQSNNVNSTASLQSLGYCQCLSGYLGSVIPSIYITELRREQSGAWVCQRNPTTELNEWVWNESGWKSWIDVWKYHYDCGAEHDSIAEWESVTDESESDSETSQDIYKRCLGYLPEETPAQTYPLGLLCKGQDTYKVYLPQFQCNRVLIWEKVYHNGVEYILPESPDWVLRPCSNKTEDAPKENPFYWRTCPAANLEEGDESESDSTLSSESSIFDDNYNKDGNYLWFRRYVTGGNYQDININGKVLFCILASVLAGDINTYMTQIPPYYRHTVILNCSTYYLHIRKRIDELGCEENSENEPCCQLPPVKERQYQEISNQLCDVQAWGWVVIDGCHDYATEE